VAALGGRARPTQSEQRLMLAAIGYAAKSLGVVPAKLSFRKGDFR
jgi:hypothetical protein